MGFAHPRAMKILRGAGPARRTLCGRRGVGRRACSDRMGFALSMTRELRYPDLCPEHAEQTLDFQASRHGGPVLEEGSMVMAMELIVERCAGIDVHQAQLRVCVRVPGAKGKRVEEFATFGTTTSDLLGLRTGWSRTASRRSRWRAPVCIGSACTTCWRNGLSCGWSTRSTSRTCPDARRIPVTRRGCAGCLSTG